MVQNPMQMIAQFNQFRQGYTGDARAEVQRLVAEGKISQPQLNQLQAMAKEFMKMINIK